MATARFKCPLCKCTDVSVEVKTWARFDNSYTATSFDDEDLHYVDVIEDGERTCHGCGHLWKPSK
jgi:hypothetical protein